MTEKADFRRWGELPENERTRLLDEYNRYQDALPRTCSLPLKIERFQAWLWARGIDYQHPN